MPPKVAVTEPPVSYIRTAAAETLQAQLTTINEPLPTSNLTQSPSPTISTPNPTTVLTSTPSATQSTPPAHSKTPPPCNLVKFVKDVTVPDNTKMDPGQSFTKTWRLRNAGSCTWTPAYALIFEGENILNAPASVQLTTGNVPPGNEIDVSVDLTAPLISGTYQQNFKLIDDKGEHFGLGNGKKPFWVKIKVVVPSGIILDFLSSANDANWKSGTGNQLDIDLTFNDNDDGNPDGVAKIKDNQILENKTTSGKILLMFPKHESDGVIAGFYPGHLIQPGDHFKARIGFIANADGTCHTGSVKFQFGYEKDGKIYVLKEISKRCDGKLVPIDVDLSKRKGQTVQFFLAVKADGDYADDWAIWSSPRIER